MGSDRAPQRGRSVPTSRSLRRWIGSRSATPRAAPDSSAETSADLVADILEMTRQAAVDGLPLAAVLDDLRLVLQLDPADVLPADVLRACALEWASASTNLEAASLAAPVTVDELEDQVWRILGSSPEHLPVRIVVLRSRTPARDKLVRDPDPTHLLDPADFLGVAARVMATVFDRPGEHIASLRSPPAATADRVVALVTGLGVGRGRGDGDRMALLEASLDSASPVGVLAWVIEVYDLGEDPRGMLASLREAVELA